MCYKNWACSLKKKWNFEIIKLCLHLWIVYYSSNNTLNNILCQPIKSQLTQSLIHETGSNKLFPCHIEFHSENSFVVVVYFYQNKEHCIWNCFPADVYLKLLPWLLMSADPFMLKPLHPILPFLFGAQWEYDDRSAPQPLLQPVKTAEKNLLLKCSPAEHPGGHQEWAIVG